MYSTYHVAEDLAGFESTGLSALTGAGQLFRPLPKSDNHCPAACSFLS